MSVNGLNIDLTQIPLGMIWREVVNSLPLTALKCSSYSIQYSGGRIWGFNMLCWAPVSIKPIAGMGLWNFKGKIWSFMDYMGTVVSRDSAERELLIHGFHFIFHSCYSFFYSFFAQILHFPTTNKIKNLSNIPTSLNQRPHPKEYIQSSRLDQCALQATSAEQYVTLEIPSELLSNWKREGYTHLHLGGIRLILTLHGREGLPVTTCLAMLDTGFKHYQDAVIGTVLTTLHAGSVLLTFYPNFNLSLQDPYLPTSLKVQVQIQGAEQISSAKIATLHHQLVYRLQNHTLDLPTPEHHSDTLMVLAESDQIPTIIQIPRQIPRHELIKLMPLEWISNYEQFHNNIVPIQTSESMFERRQDGTVRMTFKPPPSAPQEPPRLSFTYSSMITTVQIAQEDLPITGFNSEGYPVYPAKQNGHFLWDAPGSDMCDPNCPYWDDWEEDNDYATTRKKKPKKKKSPVSCHHCDPKPPQDPPPPSTPLAIYKKELKWIAKHCKSETPSPIPLPTLPLTFLNWQTQNARAQNDTLLNINSKVEKISLRTEQLETKVDSITAQMQEIHQNLQSRITQLDSELRTMLAQRYYGPEFDQKEREIRRLKAELDQIESRPTLFTTSPPIPSIGPTYHPFASMLSPIKQYDPSKLFGMTHTLFRDNPLPPPPPKPKPKPKLQPRPVTIRQSSISISGNQSPGYTPASPPAPPPPTISQPPSQSKDKEPITNLVPTQSIIHLLQMIKLLIQI
ncbi:hypothetical protein KPL70_017312 [Citrus sinensis]|nr:hypothetical protein KPL70_017312 [Citrus sinensis]